ncbi:hypothetical protein BKA56DRAFT_106084 [Ilyonectria sp. MPI-CAGE-AT-0026]|nr:hypothetical protein BKA56DRAFT_106084 [Ilyonectria sp. MPI-CAGE-AT-0026]
MVFSSFRTSTPHSTICASTTHPPSHNPEISHIRDKTDSASSLQPATAQQQRNVHQTQQHTSHLTRRNSSIPPKENLGTYCSTTVGTRPCSLASCVLRPVRSPQQRPQKGHGKSGEKEKKESRRGKAKSGNVPLPRGPYEARYKLLLEVLPSFFLRAALFWASCFIPCLLLFPSTCSSFPPSTPAGWLAGWLGIMPLSRCVLCACVPLASCVSHSRVSGSHPLIAHPHPLTSAHIHAGVRNALYPPHLHIVIHTQYQVTPLHAAVSCGARKKSTPMSVIPLVPAPCAMPPQDSILAS